MTKLTCFLKTNVSDTFFSRREDEHEFCDWVNDELYKSKLIDLETTVAVEYIDGVNSVSISINQFDSDHEVDLYVKVDTTLGEDDIAENDPLFHFIEHEVIPRFIDEFNGACKLTIPMTVREDFDDMAFNGEDFYIRIAYAGGGTDPIKYVKFQLLDDFEVYL